VDRIQDEWRRERPDVDVSPQGIIGRLHRLAAALTEEIVPVFARYGLSEGEFDVMCALRRAGHPYERHPAQLARSTMVTTGGLTKRLDRLEVAGLVERSRPSHGDGRLKVARLTPAGRELIDSAFTEHMANEARLVARLSPGDRTDLERILRSWLSQTPSTD
jgi:DNA-binding MarR family transcriptional regulator